MSTAFARKLRRRMSPPEARMWDVLRREPLTAHHFRRQVPFGPYYADFASHSARVIIEVDGSSHTEDAQITRDERRDAFLRTQGYQVLRFNAGDVLNRIGGVVEAVLAVVGER
jgi:very-short-patch-repair endonuclease